MDRWGDTLQRERGGVRDVAADTVAEQVYGQVGRHPAEGERGSERCACRYCGRAGVWTGGETPCRGREGVGVGGEMCLPILWPSRCMDRGETPCRGREGE